MDRVVQRVVFPARDVKETLRLYSEDPIGPSGRTGAVLNTGTSLRLCTYFNAFPAAYWSHWTDATRVRLDVELTREATITVWRSDSSGSAALCSTHHASRLSESLPLTAFEDGGLYWFEVHAETGTELIQGSWSISTDRPTGSLSIGITTFNRPGYCLDQLRAIAGEPALLAILDVVYVIDQGTDLVQDQPGFCDVAAVLGDRLAVIRQTNLGGSGGFTRAMLETLDAGRSRYVLLLDDDAISEPEAILRAAAFSDQTTAPVLVGGAMFHLDNRCVRYTQGETIDFGTGLARPLAGAPYDTDFVRSPLRTQDHRRRDALFNGWWMTLIPTSVLEQVGLGLPYFIKWDDLEFALRCSRAGVSTVSLPGVAVWHQAWHNKFSWRNWETYFTERNMNLTLIAHQDRPRGIPLRAFLADFGMILSLQYSSVALRIAGRTDALRGFAPLHAELGSRLGDVIRLRARFRDTRKSPKASAFPPATSGRPAACDVEPELHSLADVALAARIGMRQLLMPVSARASTAPQVELTAHEAIWRQFAASDSALVHYPDGFVWLLRDRGLAWRLLLGSARSTLSLAVRWHGLHVRHRDDVPGIAAPATWRKTFGQT